MARVKIKTHNANEPRRKTTLLKILSNTDIYPTNIIPTQHGYVVISSHKQQEKIFQDPIKNEFQQHEFTPVTPPELKAKRTVTDTLQCKLRHTRKLWGRRHQWAVCAHNTYLPGKQNWQCIFKFPDSKTIKITFTHWTWTQTLFHEDPSLPDPAREVLPHTNMLQMLSGRVPHH